MPCRCVDHRDGRNVGSEFEANQFDVECRTAQFGPGHSDASPVEFDNLLHQSETKSCSLTRRAQPGKRFEQPLGILRCYTASIVLDAETRSWSAGDDDTRMIWMMQNGVDDEIA